MVDKWLSDYKVYGEDLQALKQFSCENSHGDFKNAMRKAHDQIKIVNQDKEAFKNFWATTLSKDFQVQKQLKFNNKLNKLKTATPTPVIEQTDEQVIDKFLTEDDDTNVDLSDIGN